MIKSVNERSIRDWLAENIELFESGLTVVSKEFKLKNSVGTTGFIDILARDRFGLFVIIEVKKTSQTAREAVHELFKYAGLLKRERAVSESQIRCILASAQWSELEVPFAEYASKVPYLALGFDIDVDSTGSPSGLRRHELLTTEEPSPALPCHLIFLFADRPKRDRFGQFVIPATLGSGFSSAAIVNLECVSGSAKGQFAAYWVPFALDPDVKAKVERSIREQYEYDEAREVELTSLLEHAQIPISDVCFKNADGLEIGYPDKFRSVLNDWSISSITRIGTLGEEPFLLADEDIIEHIKGKRSSNTISFTEHSSPYLKSAWKEVRKHGSNVLSGNLKWGTCFDWICDAAELENRNSDVKFHIFNPQYLPLTLFKIATEGEGYLPSFTIGIKPEGDRMPTLFQGFLMWDGRTHPENIETVLSPMFGGDAFNWFLSYQFAESWQYEEELCRLHGLRHEVARWSFTEDGNEVGEWISVSGGFVSFLPIDKPGFQPLTKFFEQNETYVHSLLVFFDKHSTGL